MQDEGEGAGFPTEVKTSKKMRLIQMKRNISDDTNCPRRWLHEKLESDDHMRAAAIEFQLHQVWKSRHRVTGDLQKLETR